MNLSYIEMARLPTFGDRLGYLQQCGVQHEPTHGEPLAIKFYRSSVWKSFRERIIFRDIFDLAARGEVIRGPFMIHHINPLELKDFQRGTSRLLDPDNVVLCSKETHNKIHYNRQSVIWKPREPDDTIIWKGGPDDNLREYKGRIEYSK